MLTYSVTHEGKIWKKENTERTYTHAIIAGGGKDPYHIVMWCTYELQATTAASKLAESYASVLILPVTLESHVSR